MWGKTLAAALVIAILVQTQGAAVPAPGATWPVQVQETPQADGVPEHWVLGAERLSGQDLDLGERYRVLPGARLEVVDSTLRFAAHAAGRTGIVAEPGSEVVILRSTLEGDPGAFVVHAEGDFLLDQSTIRGAQRVVAQPRSVTDHVDDLAGAELERQVPGWRVARTLINGTALIRGSLIEGPSGLAAGIPVQYEASLPAMAPAVRIVDSTLRATAGLALECYVTRQAPDPDFGLPIPTLGGDEVVELALVDVVLESSTIALQCPPQPQAYALPARNLPLLDPALAGPVNALLPPPPSPEAEAGPALVTMQGGMVVGPGTGALLDGVTRLEVTGTYFQGLDPAVDVEAGTAGAEVRDALGAGLGQAFLVMAGDLEVVGGDFSGAGAVGIFVGNAAGDVTFASAAVRGFDVGFGLSNLATLDGATVEGARYQCVKAEGTPVVVQDSTLRGCGIGVHLIETSDAVLGGNGFLDNADPLRIESPGAELAHYDHDVDGNTVNGRALAYVYDDVGRVVHEAVGHIVVAGSRDIAFTDVELGRGQLHAFASTGVVVGATIGNTAALVDRLAPDAAAAWQQAGPGVRFEMYDGALRGPLGTLDEGVGNDLDQAWALVQLLRDGGRTARFVDGTVRIDTDAYLNWVGMEHPGYAYGLPGFRGTWFGDFAVMQRTWVETPVAPGLWLALDPAFEQYVRTDPLDVASLAGVDLDAPFEAGGLAPGASLSYATHSIAGVDLDAAVDAYEANNASLNAYISAHPGLTPRDLLGGTAPRLPTAGEELGERQASARYDAVPLAKQWSVRIRTSEPGVNPLHEADFWGPTPAVYGKKFNVESAPSDEVEAAQLDAAGGYYHAERSQIELTTYFFLGDRAVAADGAIPSGAEFVLPDSAAQRTVHRHPGDLVDLVIEVRAPGNVTFQEKHSAFRVGGTYAVALSIGRVSQALMDPHAAQLQASMDLLEHGPTNVMVPTHMLMGATYHLHGLAYFGMVQGVTQAMARGMDVLDIPGVDVAVTGTSLVPVYRYEPALGRYVETTYSTPPYIDVQGRSVVVHEQGDRDKAAQYLFSATTHGSNMEDKVFAGLYSTPSVSTVKVLNVAMAAGQRIYHLNASEFNDVWPSLAGLPSHVRQSILNAVNSGMDVVTTGTPVTYLDWTGVGWIEYDPRTGASGFLISGGTAPPTNAGIIPVDVEPAILNGGSGARFIIFTDNPGDRFDFGYLYGDNSVVDWSELALGATLDWGEGQTYQAYMDASKLYRGKALNNAQRALAGSIDLTGKTAKFLGTAGDVLDVGVAGIRIAEVWMDPTLTTTDQVVTTAGIAAVTTAEIVVGGIAVAKGAGAGALIGGAIGDGPGVVIGAVVGGAVAAVATGFLFDGVKKFLFG